MLVETLLSKARKKLVTIADDAPLIQAAKLLRARRLTFSHDATPIFWPYLFAPIVRSVFAMANALRALQSGHLNFYLVLIGALLIIILALAL